MISVLIPIYNYNTFPLVAALHKQCIRCNSAFEIICFDDGSSLYIEENRKIAGLSSCRITYLPDNTGRSAIRNKLVEAAAYDHLLFMDGDSVVIAPSFIQKYIETIGEADIVYGGRVHAENPPPGRKSLRWKYGKYIEDADVETRAKKPYETIFFNNTLVKKECFTRIKFDENIKHYGHEDTLFAYKAKQLNYKVKHIHNPVEHADIDDSEVYLRKTKEALGNLNLLYRDHKIDYAFVKLLRVYNTVKKLGIHLLLAFFYSVFHALMYRNLKSKHASLLVFAVYKLSYFSYIDRKKRNEH